MPKSKLKKDEKKKDEPAGTNAKEVAEAMAANMAANQADPNWETEHERMGAESAAKVLKKHKKQLADASIHIPGVTDEPEKKP